ncbi:hypothetical protein C882_0559 [Caenispirillum salinarum AK4]|uniref:DUF218 domain-containing protein n=1 Tax=Caenispirillum salinarum AK4 TaxID=1238182 RepID=K9GVM1_9PROT|nr:YdcF family protein [Caenispirillum salinarum]EKV29252.1 hypothetical protein C882_0559 [Caenispirillum salinarum AK4]
MADDSRSRSASGHGSRGARPLWRRMLRWLWSGAGIALVLALAWAAGLVWYAADIPDEVADPDTRTDAIVVLTGGSERLQTGLSLLLADRADMLFISGVHPSLDLSAVLKGTPDLPDDLPDSLRRRIRLGTVAGDTIGNAVETAVFVRDRGLRSLRLVTAGYHMRRSLLEFERAMPQVAIVPHPVFPERVRQNDWWRWPGTTLLIATEYTKYLLASLRHFLTGAGPAAALPPISS